MAGVKSTATAKTNPFPCKTKNCKRSYKTKSALNNHIRVSHQKICWTCPYCEETQVSKEKHGLHLYRKHNKKFSSTMNLDQNQHRGNVLTSKAKDAKIKSMQKTIDQQCELIVKLKTKLIEVKAKLVELGHNDSNPDDISDRNSTQSDEGETPQ